MPQQINLLDASLLRQREALGLVSGVLAMLATLGAAGGLAFGLQGLGAQATARASSLEQELVTLKARAAAVRPQGASQDAVELARLRSIEAAQQRVRAALDSGQVGSARGYSAYLLALSRQSQPALWLTGFTVAADGRALELRGRMTDPRQLPGYLRLLNAEPLFKGREFAQLSLKTELPVAGAESEPGPTEFALRSAAGPAEVVR